MSEPRTVSPTPSERVNDLPRILDAMKRAVREALVRHKKAGNPVAAWQDDRVVWIQPEDLRLEDEEQP
jgi:hypothetical protein